MFDEPIVLVDIETTGGSSKYHRITEFAGIRIQKGKVVEEFSTLINPGKPIPASISRLTGITDGMVADAPYFDELAEKLHSLFDGAYFMAHSVTFDFSFMKRQLEACGLQFTPRLLCSAKLSRKLYSGHKGHSMEKIINRFGIEVSERHRAYEDARAIYEFLKISKDQFGEEILKEALYSQLKYKSLPTNFDDSLLKNIKNTPGVYIFKDENGTPVYIGKSVNLRNRILSHFNQSTSIDKELKISMSTHKLDVIETDSEVEALLLESRLVKEKLPIHNRQLRRKNLQTLLVRDYNENGYSTLKIFDDDISSFDKPETIFGVYDNRTKAKNAITNNRKTFDLCSKLVGLENTKGACFHYQLGKCKGACINKEEPSLYNSRFEIAFTKSRIKQWKYKNPIVLIVNEFKGLVIDHWIIKGSLDLSTNEYAQDVDYDKFDMDTYRILLASLSSPNYKIAPFEA